MPEKNRKCGLVVGNLNEGFFIVGPFDDFDNAAEYADAYVRDIDSWIMKLKSPEEGKEK